MVTTATDRELNEAALYEKPVHEFVTMGYAADYLDISRRWLHVLCERGRIVNVPVPDGRVLIWMPSVRKYERDRAAGLTPKRGRPKKNAEVAA